VQAVDYRSREIQEETAPTPFYPSALTFSQKGTEVFDDHFFDGQPVHNKSTALNWVEENAVHRAKTLSTHIDSTRMFLGPQSIAVRDEVRHLTHMLAIEPEELFVISLKDGEVYERLSVFKGHTQRAHIALNKYDGSVHVLHASRQGDLNNLFYNGRFVPTESDNIDFPFMAFAQVPIGHVQTTQPDGWLSYKNRSTGKVYLRHIDKSYNFGEELLIMDVPCIGGIDFAINDKFVVFRANQLQAGSITPTSAVMKNSESEPLSEKLNFTPLISDVSALKDGVFFPANSAVLSDHLGNFHVPVDVRKNDGDMYLIDMIADKNTGKVDLCVEAIDLGHRGVGSLANFPKKQITLSSTNLGKGDGVSDGVGIIASGLSEGRIFASNSQTGGYVYPVATQLNYEMQKMHCFKTTECYTRHKTPNMVTMDYAYLESDDLGTPISTHLFYETWDMALPTPQLKAFVDKDNSTIVLSIDKDAWFSKGKTTFSINDPAIHIASIDYVDDRNVRIRFDYPELAGKEVSFFMKNDFYHHAGKAIIQ
jgi:hypothetical protein